LACNRLTFSSRSPRPPSKSRYRKTPGLLSVPTPPTTPEHLCCGVTTCKLCPMIPTTLRQIYRRRPSAGPNGGQLFVDGFTAGELPPKESIREIRINSNPFSPEYDTLGYGRIEIFTKPGTDKFHGTAFYNFGDDFWNSRNPYAAEKAPFLLGEAGGNLAGPLGKRASFTLDFQRHSIDNGAIINGSTLNPQTLAIINPYTQVFEFRSGA
jgi:hypothetical protein